MIQFNPLRDFTGQRMLDLNTHPLFKDAPQLKQLILKWNRSKEFIEGRKTLTAALAKSNYQHEIFQDPNFPEYALLAV